MNVPRALARIQFHPGFTLDDATARVPYYAELGVSHLYASPLTSARAESTHGYDVIDHQQINPALGGEPALQRLVTRLREHGMGLILDIVPNHMATQADNAWWWSVWEQGPDSPYAHYFDINWQSLDPALKGKILAPFLGTGYGQALQDGEIVLAYDEQRQAYVIRAHGNPYPIATGTLPDDAPDRDALLARYDVSTADGRNRLHTLLEAQFYRLAWWRCAPEEINWRRFFEVSELVGVCVEHADVFDAVHAKVLDLYAQGWIDGLRVDHVDGLADPIAYCARLRDAMQTRRLERPGTLADAEPYLVIEKILAHDEVLDARWHTHGTTGYDFMSQVTALLHDPAAESALTQTWQEVSKESRTADEVLLDARRLMLSRHFPVERNACVEALHEVAAADPMTRDISRVAIGRCLDLFLTRFPAYRSYANAQGRAAADSPRFEATLAKVRHEIEQECDGDDLPVLDALAGWLGGEPPEQFPEPQRSLRLTAIRRFQQLTPPLAAKSLEDTTFYQYGRLLSNNDVGGEPQCFAATPDVFHSQNGWRAAHLPHAMLTTATHDHKRGEDVRARLAVISEIPGLWEATVKRIIARENDSQAADAATLPSGRDRYMLWQTIVGAWPLTLSLQDGAGISELAERLQAWQLKSIREAKLRTSWIAPREDYEARCASYLKRVMQPGSDTLAELARFAQSISATGAVNGLSQTVIRLTAPGVPDLYQGTEFWDFSLVDPDNRRPVDFDARERALAAERRMAVDIKHDLGDATEATAVPAYRKLVENWHNGHIKQSVVRRVLQLRQAKSEVFAQGDYVPLTVQGLHAERIVAYARTRGADTVVIIVPRLIHSGIAADAASPALPRVDPTFWGDTSVVLPRSLGGQSLWDAIRLSDTHVPADGVLMVANALATYPVAVLTPQ